jgi:hypothetical protein
MQMRANARIRRGAGVAATVSMLAGAIGFSALAADAPDSRRPSATVDPCTLISVAEAQSILGVGVMPPQSSDDGVFRHCVYSSADKRNYLRLEALNTQKAMFERWMKLKQHGLPPRQLGNDAYTNSGVLLVWKNGTQLNISIGDDSGNSSADSLEDAKERAAQIALSRL